MKKVFSAFIFLNLSFFGFSSYGSTSGQIAKVSFNPQNPKGLMIYFGDDTCTFRPDLLLLKETFWFQKLKTEPKKEKTNVYITYSSEGDIQEIFLIGKVEKIFRDKKGISFKSIKSCLFGSAIAPETSFSLQNISEGDTVSFQVTNAPKNDYPRAKIHHLLKKTRLRTESSSSSASQ